MVYVIDVVHILIGGRTCDTACNKQSGRSPKVVAFFSATNFSSYIIELLKLHDTIQIKSNNAWIHNNIAIRSH